MIKNNKSVRGKKTRGTQPSYISTTSNIHIYPASKSVSKKPKAKKISSATDLQQIIQQIAQVTDKVKQVFTRNSSVSNNQNINKNIRPKINTKPTLPTGSNQPIIDNTLEWTERKQKKQISLLTISNEELCNTKCHQLIYQCMKLNKQNHKLRKQKDSLRKMLYFESKEKKQLKLQLQLQNIENNKNNKSISADKKQSISLTLSSKTNEMRKHSTITPLQESNNSKKVVKKHHDHNISKQDSKSDSLLIDFEHEDSNEKYKKIRKYEEEAESILTEKVGKSLSLERGFNNLGICKLQNYGKDKKMLRNQIIQLAEEMRWTNLKQ